MKLQSLKEKFKRMMKDEKGATGSSETLILIVGFSIVASIVVGAITIMLTGDAKDGTGGVAKNVTDSIDRLMQNMIEE